jgi:hypothetical protein
MRQRDIEAAQEQYLNKVKLYASFAALAVFIIRITTLAKQPTQTKSICIAAAAKERNGKRL